MANNPYSDGSSRTPRHAKHAARPGKSSEPRRFGARRQQEEAPVPRAAVGPAEDAVLHHHDGDVPGRLAADGHGPVAVVH